MFSSKKTAGTEVRHRQGSRRGRGGIEPVGKRQKEEAAVVEKVALGQESLKGDLTVEKVARVGHGRSSIPDPDQDKKRSAAAWEGPVSSVKEDVLRRVKGLEEGQGLLTKAVEGVQASVAKEAAEQSCRADKIDERLRGIEERSQERSRELVAKLDSGARETRRALAIQEEAVAEWKREAGSLLARLGHFECWTRGETWKQMVGSVVQTVVMCCVSLQMAMIGGVKVASGGNGSCNVGNDGDRV